ncbi:AAA family ATPase [Niameybacter massiliensis]|uniref:AAA family ATPase n=1 Tax=Holtiella tumoricola TaxID=3018743 RepID=A0AA42DMV1_9FIRM|nr:AAA family ATPase [Holtiella tumoricola]MDA3731726.1 AAA family ATPase [Holtiella tumoricola]
MIYLESFKFPNDDKEFDFIILIKRKCYDTFYPFKILSKHHFERIDFEPITILYGGNGSGKSTALNVIAEKLRISRESLYNRSNFYQDYLDLCDLEIAQEIPSRSKIITSDDVFDYMLNIRTLNEGIDEKREDLFKEYLDFKHTNFKFRSLEDYDELKKVNESRSKTQSKYVRTNLMNNIREYSNGESAYKYFLEKIEEGGLYILDEPENSLSPQRQLELVKFIEESARYFDCQFIISTHSPFLLAIQGAKIYDLDADPVTIKKWTELENVQTYYQFFKRHQGAFEDDD